MISRFKLDRLNELDAMLRADGVDVNEVAERWQVQPMRVKEYLQSIRREGWMIELRYVGAGSKRYFYADERE